MFKLKEYQKIKKNIDLLGKKTKIIAISKNHPLEEVEKAISFGLEIFGENRVQEAKSKFEEIKNINKKIKLHLTGPLQSNKVKQALSLFDVFHTLDREKLLKELIKFPEIIKYIIQNFHLSDTTTKLHLLKLSKVCTLYSYVKIPPPESKLCILLHDL